MADTTHEAQIEVNLRFEVLEGTDLTQTAQHIQERLTSPDTVAEAIPEESRFIDLVGVAAAISATVLIVRSSRELIEELRELITTLKDLYDDIHIKGLKGIFVEIGGERIPLDKVGEKELHQLV